MRDDVLSQDSNKVLYCTVLYCLHPWIEENIPTQLTIKHLNAENLVLPCSNPVVFIQSI